MIRHSVKLLIVACLVILLVACERNAYLADCAYGDMAPVTNVSGANTAMVNQEILLEVSFGVTNGCGRFGSFDQVNSGNTSTIKVLAFYEGSFCTMNAPILKAEYKFIATHAGTYELKFDKGQGNYLIHTITVT